MNFEIEIFRFGCAFLAGALLCLSGSFTQLVSENELASPSTFGFDGIAVLVLMAIHLNESFPLTIPVSLIVFILPILTIGLFFRGRLLEVLSNIEIKDLILIGLSLNLFVGAIFSIIQFLFIALNFQFPGQMWFGNFRFATGFSFYLMLLLFCIIALFVFMNRKSISLLSLGKDFAKGVGVNTTRLGTKLVLISFILTLIIVLNFGIFSFYALIIPHILRRIGFFKSSFMREALIGPLLGGTILCILDYFSYEFIVFGAEVPTGMVSSVFCSVLFILLLIKTNYKSFAKY